MTNSKTFRLFISSTFNDFRKEREVLQTKVFPHIKEYCSQKCYTFQPIDLRWGVSNEAQLDQKTLELCLSEVRACKSHMHPNFLIMIGDRYGWIPLPYAIETDEFEILSALMTQSDKEAVLEWYKKDLNQLPASYILKERSGEYKVFETWRAVETKIRTILQSAVNNSNLNEEQKRKYFLSATEAEVEEGIIPYIRPTPFQEKELLSKDSSLLHVDPQHIFGFFRDIDKSTQKENKFITDDYDEAQEFKHRVKDALIDTNTLHVKTKQTDKENLEETYLTEFEDRMTKFLETQIDAQKAKETDEKQTPLKIELQTQSYFAQTKRKDFLETKPLENLLKTIKEYISDSNQQPLVIYGPSGRGKSSLMAKAIKQAEESLQKKAIYRFIGATPYSSSSKEILTSIFEELHVDIRPEQEKVKKEEDKLTLASTENQESFEDFSYRIHSEFMNLKEDVVIFIDAVDQLQNDDQFLWLPENLPSNLKIVISALDDEKYKDDSKYFKTLKTKTQTIQEIPEFSEPKQLLSALLKKEERTLQPDQENYFLEQFKTANSPLYICVAVQELKNWKSYDTKQAIEPTQQGIIKEFVENLHVEYHHNKEFVNKVLGYLYASRDGLSESELLQLIATDKEFIQRMAPETWHENPNKELPLVHWSRLQAQLQPFLSSKSQDGEELMYFFHREFGDGIKDMPNQRDEHEAVIKANQLLIEQNQDKAFDSNRWGKLYTTLITEYELKYHDKEKQQEFSEFLSNTQVLKKEWIENSILNLTNSGENHHLNNRMYKAVAYLKIYSDISKILHKIDKYWIIHYSKSLNQLGLLYNKLNDNKSSNYIFKLFELLEENEFQSSRELTILYIEAVNNCADICKDLYNKGILVDKLNIAKKELDNIQDFALKEEYLITILANISILSQNITGLKDAIHRVEDQNIKISDQYRREELSRLYTNRLQFPEFQTINYALIAKEKISSLYKENKLKWAEDYAIVLNNLSRIYRQNNKKDDSIGTIKTSIDILKELFLFDKDRWVISYTVALHSLAWTYFEFEMYTESLSEFHNKLNIQEKYYGKNNQEIDNTREHINYVQKKLPQSATLDDLVALCTYIAKYNKSDKISIGHLYYSLQYLQLSEKAKKYLLYHPQFMEEYEGGKVFIKEIKGSSSMPREKEFAEKIEELKKIFGNNSIGRLR